MSGKYSRETKKGPGFFAGMLVGLLVALVIMAAVHYLPKLMDTTPPAEVTTAQPTDGTEATEPTDGTDATDALPTEPIDGTEPSTESTEVPEETAAIQQPVTSASDILIDTPFCTLHYPAQWIQDVKIQKEETPEKFSATIIGLIDGNEVPLFAVIFGESEEMPIGTLLCGDGTEVTVRLNLDLFNPDDGWTEEETNRAYEMIDGSTYLIEALSELENFR